MEVLLGHRRTGHQSMAHQDARRRLPSGSGRHSHKSVARSGECLWAQNVAALTFWAEA